MKKILKIPNGQGREAVYLAGMAVNSLMTKMPVGTAYAIGKTVYQLDGYMVDQLCNPLVPLVLA